MIGSRFPCLLSILVILPLFLTQTSHSQENDLKKIENLSQKVGGLYKQKRFAEAIPLAEEILAVLRKELGPEHPETAQALNNLGELYRAVGDYSKAEMLFKEALSIGEKTLGPEHPGVAIILKNMAGLYKSIGYHEKSLEMKEKALRILNSQKDLGKAKTEDRKEFSKELGPRASQGVPASDDKASIVKPEPKTNVVGPGVGKSKAATSYPYSIQLGSFRTMERVKKAISGYKKNDLTPFWVRVDLKEKGIWYRVFTGYFEDKEQAVRFRRKYGLKGSIIWKTQFAILIGVYSAEDELEVEIPALKNLGVSPYIIKDQGGSSRLFVGAFTTKIPAEAQSKRLQSKGVRGQVVKR